jgi:F0F1-type ATP synthase membrane subunit b/b'
MTEILQNISEWIGSNPLLANLGITSLLVYNILKDIICAVAKRGAEKVKETLNDAGVKKEDLVEVKNEMKDVLKEVKQLKKAIGTAYANSKLETAVKLRVQDELDGKETQVVEVVKVEEPVVLTTKSVAEKLESQLK